jgi:integrase
MSNLTARQFETLGPGKHADGDNLHLIVSPTGSRRFLYSPRVGAKRPEYGFKADTLKAARLERDRIKGLLAKGIDPRSNKPIDAPAARQTFATIAASYINEHRAHWSRHTLRANERAAVVDCAPIASKQIDDITVADIKLLLLPIFTQSPDKAARVRAVFNAVYGYACDHELCNRDRRSPAEGKTILPAVGKTERKHHAAMPYADIPALIASLRNMPHRSARALEFTILTASRANEAAAAQWSEFDLEAGIWTVPAVRMKAGKQHTVPLSKRAIDILNEMKAGNKSPFVFQGRDGDAPITTSSVYRIITVTLKIPITIHGFRSSFRDWAGDATTHARELAEMALAHNVGNSVELAYRRGSALEKRRALMNDWANYIEPADNVVRLQRA